MKNKFLFPQCVLYVSLLLLICSCNEDDTQSVSDPFAVLLRGGYNGGMYINDNISGVSADAVISLSTLNVVSPDLLPIIEYVIGDDELSKQLAEDIYILNYPLSFEPEFVDSSNDIRLFIEADDIYIERKNKEKLFIGVSPSIGYFNYESGVLTFSLDITDIARINKEQKESLPGFIPFRIEFKLYKTVNL